MRHVDRTQASHQAPVAVKRGRNHSLLRTLHVFELIGQQRLVGRICRTRAVHHPGCASELIGAEKDRCTENGLESPNQAAIFGASLVHSKYFEHLTSATETDDLTLLLNCRG